ncbi:hypothetical protein [Phyllobacterium meliloti]|uniref:hypothetical protein n=1 Tax=Phyllobacterium meliloti TaxID=555317 RepID=UPI000DDB5C68|nr:hypothetical protein [Phyllobacterium sp. T1293]UGX88372.1 hypothetical protein LLE53_018225 [Phyllobacterium sp. T1293]
MSLSIASILAFDKTERMRLIIIVAISLSLVWTSLAGAKTQFGPGAVTCATFLKDIRKHHVMGQDYRNWIAGFLSGFNETLPGPDALKEGQQDQYFRAVENKCRAMPSQPLSDAIIDLEIELRTKLGE